MILNPTEVRIRIHKEISKLTMKSRYVLLKKTKQTIHTRHPKQTAKEIDADIHCLNLTDLRRITNNMVVVLSVPERNQMLHIAEGLVKKEKLK